MRQIIMKKMNYLNTYYSRNKGYTGIELTNHSTLTINIYTVSLTACNKFV